MRDPMPWSWSDIHQVFQPGPRIRAVLKAAPQIGHRLAVDDRAKTGAYLDVVAEVALEYRTDGLETGRNRTVHREVSHDVYLYMCADGATDRYSCSGLTCATRCGSVRQTCDASTYTRRRCRRILEIQRLADLVIDRCRRNAGRFERGARVAQLVHRRADVERDVIEPGAAPRSPIRVVLHLHHRKIVVIAEREERHLHATLIEPRANRQPEYAVVETFGPVAIGHPQHDMAQL